MKTSGVVFISEKEDVEVTVEENILQPKEGSSLTAANEKLTSACRELICIYEKEAKKKAKNGFNDTVKVGQSLSPIAVLYERIRNVVDYKGEHLLRRNAIQRMVRRAFWENQKKDFVKAANLLLRELIWAKYVENNSVLTSSVVKITAVLEKYYALLAHSKTDREANAWREKIQGICSCEIEEILDSKLFYIGAISEAMFSWFNETFEWTDETLSTEEKELNIRIAIYRSLPKSDDARVRFHLLKKFYPEWGKLTSSEAAQNLPIIVAALDSFDRYLHSPLQTRLFRFIQKHTAPFQILRQLVEESPLEAKAILEDEEKLEAKIADICKARYKEIGNAVSRGIVRSIIYIFATKIIFVLIFELPYEMLVFQAINFTPLLINLISPPLAMFLIGITIRKPSDKNTRRIIERIKSFVYPKEDDIKIPFSLSGANTNSISYRVFFIIYLVFFLVIFGGISYLLYQLHYNIVSAGVFFMFMSLVLLFGFRVRFSASELNTSDEKEGFFTSLFLNISLPFLNVGIFLSKGLSKLNFFIVIMDFLIEAPLKSILEVVDEWSKFLKERKEEAVEVPGQ